MVTRMFRQPQVVIIKNYTSNAVGIAAFIFGLISIIWLAPLFVPLAVLFGIVAIISRQFAWGSIGLICAFIGFLTSPILMGIFGVTAIVTNLPSHNSMNSAQQQAQQLETRRQNFVIESNDLVQKMKNMDTHIDVMLEALPKVEEKYHAITAKISTHSDEAQSLSGGRNGVTRSQIIVAMNQDVIATNQLNIQVQATEGQFRSNVAPLLKELASMEQNCPAVDSRVIEACQRLHNAGSVFRTDSKALAEGLDGLDRTYQTELAAQQAMIAKTDQIQ